MIFNLDREDSIYVARDIERSEWDDFWAVIAKTNLMQSWEYGEAKKQSGSWAPSRYVIETKQGEPVAIVQVLSKTVPVLGGVARCNRGPLLLSGPSEAPDLNYAEVVKSLLSLQKSKRWWLLFVAPEIARHQPGGIESRSLGLIRRRAAPWGSVTLDLTASVESLQENLNGKWRNLLRKSQKFGFEAHQICGNQVEVDNLIAVYEGLQASKGFSGMPSDLVRALSRVEGANWKFSAYIVEKHQSNNDDEKILGMLISVIHGKTATYLIGFSSEQGRKHNVNYFLLWRAILDAKSYGCKFYDLGGLNSNTPKGIAHFKKGLSGSGYTLAGEYIATIFSKQKVRLKKPAKLGP